MEQDREIDARDAIEIRKENAFKSLYNNNNLLTQKHTYFNSVYNL